MDDVVSRTAGIERRPCKACGTALVIVPGPAGKRIPLVRVRSVYQLEDGDDHATKVSLDCAYVSHFETCPKATEFSRGKRKRPDPAAPNEQ